MCVALRADPIILFNDFGPSNSFRPPPGIAVGCGANCWNNAGYSHAWSFVPGGAASLSTISTAAWQFLDTPSTLTIALAADSSGVPGTVLESFTAELTPEPQLLTFTSSIHPLLLSGKQYWFVAGTEDLINQAAELAINPIGTTGLEALRVGGDAWLQTTSSAYATFSVTGDAISNVPEPSVALLLASAVVLILFGQRADSVKLRAK